MIRILATRGCHWTRPSAPAGNAPSSRPPITGGSSRTWAWSPPLTNAPAIDVSWGWLATTRSGSSTTPWPCHGSISTTSSFAPSHVRPPRDGVAAACWTDTTTSTPSECRWPSTPSPAASRWSPRSSCVSASPVSGGPSVSHVSTMPISPCASPRLPWTSGRSRPCVVSGFPPSTTWPTPTWASCCRSTCLRFTRPTTQGGHPPCAPHPSGSPAGAQRRGTHRGGLVPTGARLRHRDLS